MQHYSQIISDNLYHLKNITAPFANSAEHVQGPGGNTSFKVNDVMLIKSSGYTFKNVTDDTGVVLLSVQEVLERIDNKKLLTGNMDTNGLPDVLSSAPAVSNQKPSMEYEFHALLNSYVLHTHSVYSNIISCSSQAKTLLASLFPDMDHLLVPYVTPGFPIASFLYDYKQAGRNIPPVIFLKNHGIIVHGDNEQSVIENYRQVEKKIKQVLKIKEFYNADITQEAENIYSIAGNSLFGDFDFENAVDILERKILIPDQAIFFNGKVSVTDKVTAPINIDPVHKKIMVKGNQKFADACADMIQAIQFINTYQLELQFLPDYLPAEEIQLLCNLPAEKHRIDLLKN